MLKINEVIIVEGRYDKIRLSSIVDAVIIETGGFGLFSNSEKLNLIRKIAKNKGIIIFTDSDEAGFKIRSYICGSIDKTLIRHAYIPDVFGKEKRKVKAGKEGKLGVEGMTNDIIIQALLNAGATPALPQNSCPVTKADMMEDGLSGMPDSSERRRKLAIFLGLPQRISSNGLLDFINSTMTKEDYKKAIITCLT